jgi:cytosine/uracil/thiamine/allantoin permease
LYDYAWFDGFFVAAVSYYFLMLRNKENIPAPLSVMTYPIPNE